MRHLYERIPDSHIFTAFLESQNNLQYENYMREIPSSHIFTACGNEK